MTIKDSLAKTRDILLTPKATGEDGFEGFVGTLLSKWTALPMRSAKSGFQTGHDGATAMPSPLSVLYETKRYDETRVSLRELQGELAIVGSHYLDLDLYVVATTQTLGTKFDRELGNQAKSIGIELLLLDWDGDLPLLAVFAAGRRDATLTWFARHHPGVDRPGLEAALMEIEQDASFNAAAEALAAQLSVATLGLVALQGRAAAALETLFADRGEARAVFGQYLAPADVALASIERPTLMARVDAWYQTANASTSLAILGGEGVGKSWVVPQWWLRQKTLGFERPILLVAPSQFMRGRGYFSTAFGVLADLIVFTLGDGAPETKDRWEARLRRWSSSPNPPLRFLVVLDGLNEATTVPWSQVVDVMAKGLLKLGGRLALTCREAFFDTEIKDKLPLARPITRLQVKDYAPEELEAAAAARSVDVLRMSQEMRAFVSNPRILSVAAGMLPKLAGGQLTVPRLLMVAWQHRMQERGNLVAHNDHEMREIVASHGKAIREGRTSFEINKWKRHSSRAERVGPGSLDDDLTEVVDSSFSESIPDCPGQYRIRDRAFGFALGLLLVDELKAVDEARRENVLADALDQLSGFDRTVEIVAAAVGIAMLAPGFDASVCTLLLCAWIGLQNLSEQDFDQFAAYAADQPGVYLDAVERVHAVTLSPKRMWPVIALSRVNDRLDVAPIVKARCREWMGFWHFGDRYPLLRTNDASQIEAMKQQSERHIAAIATTIECLSEAEREVFERTCRQVDSVHLPNIVAVVPLLLAGLPLADCADGLVGWMLAVEVAERSVARTGIEWVFDLNQVDQGAAAAACLAVAEDLLKVAECRATRNAAGRVFGMSGTNEGDRRFAEIYEIPPGPWTSARRGEQADPLDPVASAPSPPNAQTLLEGLDPTTVCSGFGMGPDDHTLDRASNALTRFSYAPLVKFWRDAIAGIIDRNAMGARQLTFELPRLSPLLEKREVDAVRSLLASLGPSDHPLRQEGNVFVAGYLANALFPHLDGEAQLRLLTTLPAEVMWPDELPHMLVPVAADYFEAALARAVSSREMGAAGPVLLFVANGRQDLTAKALDLVKQCLHDPSPYVRSLVLKYAVAAESAPVLAHHLAGSWSARGTNAYEAFYGSLALVHAAKMARVPMPFARMASQMFSHAAALGTRQDQEEWMAIMAASVGRVVGGSARPSAPVGIARLTIRERAGHVYPYFAADRHTADGKEDDAQDVEAVLSFEATMTRQVTDNAKRNADIEALQAELRLGDVTFLGDAPSLLGYDEAARLDVERIRTLVRTILATTDQAALSRLKNFGMSLVPSLLQMDEPLAIDLFLHLYEASPFIPAYVGVEETPFEIDALFAAAGSDGIVAIKERILRCASNDGVLARLVLASRMRGNEGIIRAIASRSIASPHPRDRALAVTLFGFCEDADDEVDQLVAPLAKGRGFVATAARRAVHANTQNRRSRHWLAAAEQAIDPVDVWRYGTLAAACADYRYAIRYTAPTEREASQWSRFARALESKLSRQALKVAEDRRKTLYGSEKPHAILASLLEIDDVLVRDLNKT